MVFCEVCGEENDDSARFCAYCGANLSQVSNSNFTKQIESDNSTFVEDETGFGFSQQIKESEFSSPQPSQYPYRARKPERTIQLSIVIVLYWVSFGLFGIITMITIFIFFPLGLAFALLTWLQFWIARGLSDYKESARVVGIILALLGLITDLLREGGIPILSITIGIFTIYTLAFHEDTVLLFE